MTDRAPCARKREGRRRGRPRPKLPRLTKNCRRAPCGHVPRDSLTPPPKIPGACGEAEAFKPRNLAADGRVIPPDTVGEVDHADRTEPLYRYQQRKQRAVEGDRGIPDQGLVVLRVHAAKTFAKAEGERDSTAKALAWRKQRSLNLGFSDWYGELVEKPKDFDRSRRAQSKPARRLSRSSAFRPAIRRARSIMRVDRSLTSRRGRSIFTGYAP